MMHTDNYVTFIFIKMWEVDIQIPWVCVDVE